MPVVFIPEESETECIAENRMSSFGFLGLVLSAMNAVINVANNINNNNNNRNNNNNDNNNNQVNTNIANSMNEQMVMSMAMTGRRVLAMERLRKLRNRVMRRFYGANYTEEVTEKTTATVSSPTNPQQR